MITHLFCQIGTFATRPQKLLRKENVSANRLSYVYLLCSNTTATDLDLSYPREAKLHGWKSACSPLSQAWIDPLPKSGANGVTTPPTVRQLAKLKYTSPMSKYSEGEFPKTFIHDHKAAIDICEHPQYFWMHGQFLAYGEGPVPQHVTLQRRGKW